MLDIDRYLSVLDNTSLAIFLFHGVIEEPTIKDFRNYNKKHIHVDGFNAFIKKISQAGNCVSLDQLVDCVKSGNKLPPRAFAITFDDGFYNNFSLAAPILRDYKCYSTFYITSDFVDKNFMSWIDRIELALSLSAVDSINFLGLDFQLNSKGQKIKFLEEVREHFKSGSLFDFDEVASSFQKKLLGETVYTSDDMLYKKMGWWEVKELDSCEFFSVGAHTKTHAILSALSAVELQNEINYPICELRKQLGRPVHHFSYPEGLGHHFNSKVIEMLKIAGICCSPSAIHGVNRFPIVAEDLFYLRRIFVV